MTERSGCRPLIRMVRCAVQGGLSAFDWEVYEDELWAITGNAGGGKEALYHALSGRDGFSFLPLEGGSLSLPEPVMTVSLEAAADLIREERLRDESEYTEGGIDPGRSVRSYIAEVLSEGVSLDACKEIELCSLRPLLDRGLKYLSSGEMRRLFSCRALLSGAGLVILSEPFSALDASSRAVFRSLFARARETCSARLLLFFERSRDIPDEVSHVLECSEGRVSFAGRRSEYMERVQSLLEGAEALVQAERKKVGAHVDEIRGAQQESLSAPADVGSVPLVQMRGVNVGWGDKRVLEDLNWTVQRGEHWLIRGPNGSGKTTLLELISGDNTQVFCNDISLFGRRRGTGETIWEIKERLGIVSYRLHLEYRMVAGTDIEAVVISGLRDTIGLYAPKTDLERQTAGRWLELGGLASRAREAFSALSYGEQRALLILRAAVKCPPLIILDEPCHGLNEAQRDLVLALLERVGEAGYSTLLHVTHDPSEVLSCETHVLELVPGFSPMYTISERK